MCGGGLVRAGVGTLRPNIKECLHSDWLRAGAAMEKVKLVFNSRNCQRGKFCRHSSSGFPRSIFQRYCATGKTAAREPQSATTPKAPPSVTGEHSWFCDGATVCLENLRLRHEPFGRTSHRKDAQQEQRKDLDSVPYYTHLQILFLWYNKRRRLTSGTSQQKHQQTCISCRYRLWFLQFDFLATAEGQKKPQGQPRRTKVVSTRAIPIWYQPKIK